MTSLYPRCPFAQVGLQGTWACPGFYQQLIPQVRLPWFSLHPLPAGESCLHLRSQASPRGFVTACHHPGGLPLGAVTGARAARQEPW